MLTIFLSTFNRLQTLTRTVESFRRLVTPHELVIIDNGSDHPDCVALLERLEQLPEVRKIYPLRKVASMVELTENFNVALADQYASASEGDWFAVTDADICFEGSSPHSLRAYIYLAKALGFAVGPHLRVDAGIPAGYPLRSRVLVCETRLLYRDSMESLGGIAFSRHPIDTTFHLFPAAPEHRRLRMETVRVGAPYDAMHLDWYVDVFAPTPENAIYVAGAGLTASWGGNWLRDYWLAFQESPEAAFELLTRSQRMTRPDLCNISFMLSWSYQFGVGTAVDLDESERWLRAAIPHGNAYYWPYEESWMRMIYAQDFGGLSRTTKDAVAA